MGFCDEYCICSSTFSVADEWGVLHELKCGWAIGLNWHVYLDPYKETEKRIEPIIQTPTNTWWWMISHLEAVFCVVQCLCVFLRRKMGRNKKKPFLFRFRSGIWLCNGLVGCGRTCLKILHHCHAIAESETRHFDELSGVLGQKGNVLPQGIPIQTNRTCPITTWAVEEADGCLCEINRCVWRYE